MTKNNETLEFIEAVEAGVASKIETTFNSLMNDRVADALEAMKMSIANGLMEKPE